MQGRTDGSTESQSVRRLYFYFCPFFRHAPFGVTTPLLDGFLLLFRITRHSFLIADFCIPSSLRGGQPARGQRERHEPPAIEEQVDPDKEPDHPEARERPFVPDHQPEHERNDAAH